MIKLQYRPEIDALRAIAVVAVIIYHAKVYFLGNLILPGGFLGVDIFFVISGYLISSLIYKELKETKNFSFKNFYERRARRILPALFVVILVSIPFAWKYILPTSFIDYAKSILYSIGFGSNLYFYYSGQLYGAESGLLKPLLHTWSLSIEEQYYIVFPLLFFVICNYFKNKIIIIISVIALLSLIFSEYLSGVNAPLNFYILLSRSWELLFGTLIFLLESFRKKKVNIYNNFYILIGLVLIISSLFLFEDSDGHPNVKSLYPIMGVALVIYFSSAEVLITKLLSNKLIVGVGLISYSLYLWHYPIFAFSRISYFTKDIFDYGVVGLVIFILSILTYLFIEKPFKSKKKINSKYFLLLFFSVLIFLTIFSLTVIKNKGFEYRYPQDSKFSLDNQKYSEQVRLKKYELGSPNFMSKDKVKILIFGNSHGRDFFNMFALNEGLFSDYEFSMMDGQVHCLRFLDEKKLCEKKLSKKMLSIFHQSDVFLISTRYSKEDVKELNKVIQILKTNKKKIIITSDYPQFYFVNSRNLVDEFYYRNNRLPTKEEKLLIEKNKFESRENANIDNQILKKISKKNNIEFLDKNDYVCNNIELRCYSLTDGNEKINLDSSHTTLAGAKYFGKKIADSNWLKIN